MTTVEHWLVPALWVLVLAYWILSARGIQHDSQAETKESRLIHLVLVSGAFCLIAVPIFHVGPLGWRWLPRLDVVFWLGAGLTAVGLGFSVWARRHLGRYWSGTIAVKAKHELIRTGPYALVRHPIYTGFIVGIMGTALAVGELRGLLSIVMLVTAYVRKIRIEERWLVRQFGETYVRYQKDVKALLPFVV
jgi:protein-S-isoprenylcysteine O-methyltransferase Ste14